MTTSRRFIWSLSVLRAPQSVWVLALLVVGVGLLTNTAHSQPLTGTTATYVVDDFEAGRVDWPTYLTTATGQRYLLDDVGGAETLVGGESVQIVGGQRIRQASLLGEQTVRGGTVYAMPTTSPAEASDTATAVERVAVFLVNFRDDTREPFTLGEAETVYFGSGDNSATSTIAAYTKDQVHLTGEVFGYYTLDMDTSNQPDYFGIRQALLDAYDDAVDFTQFDALSMVFPRNDALPFSGIAALGRDSTETDDGVALMALSVINGRLTRRVVAHELLHNLGLRHDNAGAYANDDYTGPLTHYEGDNPFSIMGEHSKGYPTVFTRALHWPGLFTTHQVDEPGRHTFDLAAATDTTRTFTPGTPTPTQAILVPLGSGGEDPYSLYTEVDSMYVFEYREASGSIPAGVTVSHGSLVRHLRPTAHPAYTSTRLLYHPTLHNRYVVQPGEVFYDVARDLRLHVLEPTGTGAMRVEVAFMPSRVATEDADVPSTTPRLETFPTPFRTQTTLQVDQPTSHAATVAVYDLLGRHLRTLHDGLLPAGMHTLVWDGRDDAGRPVGSGVYLIRLVAGSQEVTRPVVKH